MLERGRINFTVSLRSRKEHGYFVLAIPILRMRILILKKNMRPNLVVRPHKPIGVCLMDTIQMNRKLAKLRLRGIATTIEQRMNQAITEKWAYSMFLETLLTDEIERRD